MVCKKCGREIEDTAKFCTFCGAVVTPQAGAGTQPRPVRAQTVPAQNRSRFPWILTCCVLALALLVVGGILLAVTFAGREESSVPVSQSGENAAAAEESAPPTEAPEDPVSEGESLLAAGRYEEAVEAFTAQIAKAPGEPLGYLRRADAYAAWANALFEQRDADFDAVMEKYRLAAEDYRIAAESDPDLPQGDAPCIAYWAAAEKCLEEGDSAEAMRWAALSRDALENGTVSDEVLGALGPLVGIFFNVSDQVLLEERTAFTPAGGAEAVRYGRAEYVRDGNGRVVEKRTTRADLPDAAQWTPDSETFYVYNESGALFSEVTQLHYAGLSSSVPEESTRTVLYFYDDLGRLTRTVTGLLSADGRETFSRKEYYYDDAENPTRVSSTSVRVLETDNWHEAVSGNEYGTGAGNTKFTYDEEGREVLREIWGGEGRTESAYDDYGRLLRVTDEGYDGTTVTELTYGLPQVSAVPAGSGVIEHLGLRVEIPASWDGKFVAIPYRSGLRFYSTADWLDLGGHLVTLMFYAEGEEYDYLPAYEVVGTLRKDGKAWTVVAMFPTDVQFDQETAEVYNELANTVPELLRGVSAADGAVFEHD